MASGYSCEHDECIVVHEGWQCPLCLVDETLKEAETRIKELEDKDGD